MNDRVTKNYSTDGGDTLVIGGKLVIEESAVIEGLSGDGTPYALPPASAERLGGVKVGSGLSIDENGVLSADGITPAANQASLGDDAELSDVASKVNALLLALKTAGLMAADE